MSRTQLRRRKRQARAAGRERKRLAERTQRGYCHVEGCFAEAVYAEWRDDFDERWLACLAHRTVKPA